MEVASLDLCYIIIKMTEREEEVVEKWWPFGRS